ncbi:MAG: protein kinase [Gemmatimonadetes bacterium]|nr:protein kinase [Gemmatimonadota bacterium]
MAGPTHEHRSATPLPPFAKTIAVAGVAFLVLFAMQVVISVRHGDEQRVIGWTASESAGRWTVRDVAADGPAAGALLPGDTVFAVNGDARYGDIGPQWALRHAPPGSSYVVRVGRAGGRHDVALRQVVVHDATYRPWIVSYLFEALVFAAVGVLLGLAKPNDPVVRAGAISCLLEGPFFLWDASRPYDGVLQGPALTMQLLLVSSFPIYSMLGYRFLSGFPTGERPRGVWRAIGVAIVAGTIAVWVPRTSLNVLQTFGPAVTTNTLVALGAVARTYRHLGPFADQLVLFGTVLAMLCVLARNYLHLREGDQRRRIRIVGFGVALGSLSIAASTVIDGLVLTKGASAGMRELAATYKAMANAIVVAMPLSIAYAVIRYRVLGVTIIIRAGLRYLLAKSVLQGVVALPALFFAWTLLSHRDATVGELLFGGTGRANLGVATAGLVLLRYRKPVRDAVDRRFFRESYDQEQLLITLADGIKALDTVQQIAAMVTARIDEALHVQGAVVLFREHSDASFVVGHTSGGLDARHALPATSCLLSQLERARQPTSWRRLRDTCDDADVMWIDGLGIDLLVPVLGVDQDLVGVLMLGPKRSEEPYTRRDRALLQTIGSQVGAVYEVLTLRAQVTRDQKVQRQVLDRLSERDVNLLKQCPACGRCYDRTATRCDDDGASLELTLPIERVVAGRYRLDRLLGEGGMGAVFRAHDERLGRAVAVKVMTGALFGDPAARRRFAREAQALARLEHPNVIRVYDVGELVGEGAFLAMELVEGVTWGAMLARHGGTLPGTDAAPLFRQLLDGVQAAHDAQVVHRDLKPENLLLGTDGDATRVKILDFGLAKMRSSSDTSSMRVTATGMALGTLGYMAPEQLFGDEVDHRADLYAIGVIALETMTGPVPRAGFAVHELVERQLRQRLLGDDAGRGARALGEVLARCLAHDPAKRFDSASVLKGALLSAVEAFTPSAGGA